MGGSLSSCLGSSRDYRDDDVGYEQARYVSTKVRPSDDDGLWYVGERDVDLKAAAYIAKFHESTRFTGDTA